MYRDQTMGELVAFKQYKNPRKVVAVAYRKWSFTTGSNCKALTEKIVVFFIVGRLWEVVAYET